MQLPQLPALDGPDPFATPAGSRPAGSWQRGGWQRSNSPRSGDASPPGLPPRDGGARGGGSRLGGLSNQARSDTESATSSEDDSDEEPEERNKRRADRRARKAMAAKAKAEQAKAGENAEKERKKKEKQEQKEQKKQKKAELRAKSPPRSTGGGLASCLSPPRAMCVSAQGRSKGKGNSHSVSAQAAVSSINRTLTEASRARQLGNLVEAYGHYGQAGAEIERIKLEDPDGLAAYHDMTKNQSLEAKQMYCRMQMGDVEPLMTPEQIQEAKTKYGPAASAPANAPEPESETVSGPAPEPESTNEEVGSSADQATTAGSPPPRVQSPPPRRAGVPARGRAGGLRAVCASPFARRRSRGTEHEAEERQQLAELAEATAAAASRAGSGGLSFAGSIDSRRGAEVKCIVSFPGQHEEEWSRMLGPEDQTKRLHAACVFFKDSDPLYGQHTTVDQETKECHCHSIYGAPVKWGCAWFDKWKSHVAQAVEKDQTLVVCYCDGQLGQGKCQWRELPHTYPERERHRQAGELRGLGISQAAEVAWLDSQGYEYEEVDATTVTIKDGTVRWLQAQVAGAGPPTETAALDAILREESAVLSAIEGRLEALEEGFDTAHLFTRRDTTLSLTAKLLLDLQDGKDPELVLRSCTDVHMVAAVLLDWILLRTVATIPHELCEDCCSLAESAMVAPSRVQFRSQLFNQLNMPQGKELRAVVDALPEPGRSRLLLLVNLLQRVSRVSPSELSAVCAPFLFAQTWLDSHAQVEDYNHVVTCCSDFLALLIEEWSPTAGTKISIEDEDTSSVALRLISWSASKQRRDTKEQALHDAQMSLASAERQELRLRNQLGESLGRLEEAAASRNSSSAADVIDRCTEFVQLDAEVAGLREKLQAALTHQRLLRLRNDKSGAGYKDMSQITRLLHAREEAAVRVAYLTKQVAEKRNRATRELDELGQCLRRVSAEVAPTKNQLKDGRQLVSELLLQEEIGALDDEIRAEQETRYSQRRVLEQDIERIADSLQALQRAAEAARAGASAGDTDLTHEVAHNLDATRGKVDALQEELSQPDDAMDIPWPSGSSSSSSGLLGVAKAGWMSVTDSSDRNIARWSRKWCQIERGALVYYDKPPTQSGRQLGELILSAGTHAHAIAQRVFELGEQEVTEPSGGAAKGACKVAGQGRRWCLLVIPCEGHIVYLQANCAREQRAWLAAVSYAIVPSKAWAIDTDARIIEAKVDQIDAPLLGIDRGEHDKQRFRTAAALTFDALYCSGDLFSCRLDEHSLRYFRFSQLKPVRYSIYAGIIVHLALGFCEPTLLQFGAERLGGSGGCAIARIVELVVCTIHTMDCSIRCRLKLSPMSDTWLIGKSVATLVCSVTCVILLGNATCQNSGYSENGATLLHVGQLFRPVFLVDKMPALRKLSTLLLSSLRELKGYAIVIFTIIVFYVMIGQIMFLDTIRTHDSECTRQQKSAAAEMFNTFQHGLSELLYVALGGRSFADVFLPGFVQCNTKRMYTATKLDAAPTGVAEDWLGTVPEQLCVAMYFISFICCMVFIARNVVLSVVYKVYVLETRDTITTEDRQRRTALLLVFKLCDTNNSGVLDRVKFKRLMQDISEWTHKECNPSYVEHVWSLLDEESVGTIQAAGFCELTKVIMESVPEQTPQWLTAGSSWHAKGQLSLPVTIREKGEVVLELTALKQDSREEAAYRVASQHVVDVGGAFGQDLSDADGHSGMMRCSLSWEKPGDLDLECVVEHFPGQDGRTAPPSDISYRKRTGSCGGQLEHLSTKLNLENIYWDKPPPGEYTFRIRNDRNRLSEGTRYRCELYFPQGGRIAALGLEDAYTDYVFREPGFTLSLEGTLYNSAKIFSVDWGGYDEVSQHVGGTIPRIQRAIKAIDAVSSSRADATSEPNGLVTFLGALATDSTSLDASSKLDEAELRANDKVHLCVVANHQHDSDVWHARRMGQLMAAISGVVTRSYTGKDGRHKVDIFCDYSEDDRVHVSCCSSLIYGGLFPRTLRNFLLRRVSAAVMLLLRAVAVVALVSLATSTKVNASCDPNVCVSDDFAPPRGSESAGSWLNGVCDPPDPSKTCGGDGWGDAGSLTTWIFLCNLGLTVEMALKVFAFGAAGYWHTPSQRIDGMLALCGLIGSFRLLGDDARASSTWDRIWQVCVHLRMLSLIKLVVDMQHDGASQTSIAFIKITARCTKQLWPFVLYLGAILYVYGVLGIQFFSAIDQQSKDLLSGSPYAAEQFYWEGLHFNDLNAAMLTLFHQLLQHDWYITHDACMRVVRALHEQEYGGVCDASCRFDMWLVILYFVSFQIIVATVFVGLVTSTFLDCGEIVNGSVWKRRHAQRRRNKIQVRGPAESLHVPSTAAERTHGCGGSLRRLKSATVDVVADVVLDYHRCCYNCCRTKDLDGNRLHCEWAYAPLLVPQWQKTTGNQSGPSPITSTEGSPVGFEPVLLCTECTALYRAEESSACHPQGRRRHVSASLQYGVNSLEALLGSSSALSRAKMGVGRAALHREIRNEIDDSESQSSELPRAGAGASDLLPTSSKNRFAVFGTPIEHLPPMRVLFAGCDADAAAAATDEPCEVPVFLVELIKKLKKLEALNDGGAVLAKVFGSEAERREVVDSAVEKEVALLIQEANKRSRASHELFRRSDSQAVWAEILRRWHLEMPPGDKLLSWPRGSQGRAKALSIGRRRPTARTEEEVAGVLRRLSPQRYATVKYQLLEFWMELDLDAPMEGALQSGQLAAILASAWFDLPLSRSMPSSQAVELSAADVEAAREEKAEAVGFISHILAGRLGGTTLPKSVEDLMGTRKTRKLESIKQALTQSAEVRETRTSRASRGARALRTTLWDASLPDLRRRAIVAKVERSTLEACQEAALSGAAEAAVGLSHATFDATSLKPMLEPLRLTETGVAKRDEIYEKASEFAGTPSWQKVYQPFIRKNLMGLMLEPVDNNFIALQDQKRLHDDWAKTLIIAAIMGKHIECRLAPSQRLGFLVPHARGVAVECGDGFRFQRDGAGDHQQLSQHLRRRGFIDKAVAPSQRTPYAARQGAHPSQWPAGHEAQAHARRDAATAAIAAPMRGLGGGGGRGAEGGRPKLWEPKRLPPSGFGSSQWVAGASALPNSQYAARARRRHTSEMLSQLGYDA